VQHGLSTETSFKKESGILCVYFHEFARVGHPPPVISGFAERVTKADLHSALNANHQVFYVSLFLIYSSYEPALCIIILVLYISYAESLKGPRRDSTGFNYIWSEKDKLLKSYWNVSTRAFFGRHGGARCSFLKFSKRVQPCGRIILFKIPEASESGKPDGAKPRNFLLSDSYTCRRYVISFPENSPRGRERGKIFPCFFSLSRAAEAGVAG